MIAVDTTTRRIHVDGAWVACVIGRAGAIAAADKQEGDGATPLGDWSIRGALLRPDRGFLPPPRLPWRWLRPDDGWSDDPGDGGYNQPVRHPHAWSAERLWREDGLYDVIVWLGYNDAPTQPGAGSAIFLHLSRPTPKPTEGCVGVSRDTMASLLRTLAYGDVLSIR